MGEARWFADPHHGEENQVPDRADDNAPSDVWSEGDPVPEGYRVEYLQDDGSWQESEPQRPEVEPALAPAGPGGRGPSRLVRLRRTMAAVFLINLIPAVTVSAADAFSLRGDDATSTVGSSVEGARPGGGGGGGDGSGDNGGGQNNDAAPGADATTAPSKQDESVPKTGASTAAGAAGTMLAAESVTGGEEGKQPTSPASPKKKSSKQPKASAEGHPFPDDVSGSAQLMTVPKKSKGTYTAIDWATEPNVDSGRDVSISFEVEDGVPIQGKDAGQFILETLQDERGWQGVDKVRFVPVNDPAKADLNLKIASPDRVDTLCAPLDTQGKYSCRNGRNVVLNAQRWKTGSATIDDITEYRYMLINHEVGHGLGHGHEPCGGEGEPAPIMLQQTMHLNGCTVWAWPQPPQDSSDSND